MDIAERPTAIGLSVGSGSQVIGLLDAGFDVLAVVEADRHSFETLAGNLHGSRTKVVHGGTREFDPATLGLAPGETDLVFGRITQFGLGNSGDQFPPMLNIVDYLEPRAVLIEYPEALLTPPQRYEDYRNEIRKCLESLGYKVQEWRQFRLHDFGVPQAGSVAALVALKHEYEKFYCPPRQSEETPLALDQFLEPSMRKRFTEAPRATPDHAARAFHEWLMKAAWHKHGRDAMVPRLVPLGASSVRPSRNDHRAWRELGIDVSGIAYDDKRFAERDLFGPYGPKLTVGQAALIQGFPSTWRFSGRVLNAYRQVVESSPPWVAGRFGQRILDALRRNPDAAKAREEVREVRKTIGEIDDLDPLEFEYFVADLMARDGYRIISSGGGPGDGGVDVRAEADLNVLVLVQCKHFESGNNSVSPSVARQIAGSAAYERGPTVPIVVTNGRFSKQCVEEATKNRDVRLVDRAALTRWSERGEPMAAVIR
ncbi:restriction endonuclease [Streptomyces violascens]|uniref:restriction endonuclease n=1 Tax=Streptomyces violascens TaxID=67381 RepID=UPI0036A4364E